MAMDNDNESIDSNDERYYGNDYPEDEDESDDDDDDDGDYYDGGDYDDDTDDDDDDGEDQDALHGHNRTFDSRLKSMLRKDVKKLSKAMTDFILCNYFILGFFFGDYCAQKNTIYCIIIVLLLLLL